MPAAANERHYEPSPWGKECQGLSGRVLLWHAEGSNPWHAQVVFKWKVLLCKSIAQWDPVDLLPVRTGNAGLEDPILGKATSDFPHVSY